ncbi:hypothetical protein ABZP36_010805 [Zizania latifolia]
MQDQPPPDANGDAADTAAKAYVKRLAKDLLSRVAYRNNANRFRHLLRQRPAAADFPAAVTAALDDLDDLFSEESAPMVAYDRDLIRFDRLKLESSLRQASHTAMSVAATIRELVADHAEARKRLRAARATIRRTTQRLPVAGRGQEEGAAAEETTALVLTLVERLQHAQGKEAALVADMEATKRSFPNLLRQHGVAKAQAFADMTALMELPVLPPPDRQEAELIVQAIYRFEEDYRVLFDFAVHRIR